MSETVHGFDLDEEAFRVYDYEKHRDGGLFNVVRPVWEYTGGVDDGGFIWADERHWTIDTPETPHSILALFTYRKWRGLGPLDLRDAEISLHARGDGLDLKGAQVFFWVVSEVPERHCRWHFTAHPIAVTDGAWGPVQTFVLRNDQSLWHHSWTSNTCSNPALGGVLAEAESFGLSFIGFSEKVTGRFAIDELRIRGAR